MVGFNWVIVPTNFNIATQRSVPGWVKGRAIAMYMTVLFGSFAVGSPIWGRVATARGISAASFIAGCLIIAGLALVKIFPLNRAKDQDFGPANLPAPTDAPTPGGVEMVIRYAVDRARTAEFAQLMHGELRRCRLRNGAARWHLSRRDEEGAANGVVVYEETFLFESWGDRMRFNARTTKFDAATEAEARGFVVGDEPNVVYRELKVADPGIVTPVHSGRVIPPPPPVVDWKWVCGRVGEEFDRVWDRFMRARFNKRRK